MRHRLHRARGERGTALLAALLVTLAVTAISMIAARGAILEARSARSYSDALVYGGASGRTFNNGMASLGCMRTYTQTIHPVMYDSTGTGAMAIDCDGRPQYLVESAPEPIYPGDDIRSGYARAMTLMDPAGGGTFGNWTFVELRASHAEGSTVSTGGVTEFTPSWQSRTRGYALVELGPDSLGGGAGASIQ